jgi:hypothetical protein
MTENGARRFIERWRKNLRPAIDRLQDDMRV